MHHHRTLQFPSPINIRYTLKALATIILELVMFAQVCVPEDRKSELDKKTPIRESSVIHLSQAAYNQTYWNHARMHSWICCLPIK